MTITVLRRPEADVAAEAAAQWGGDADKVATALTDRMTVHGVEIRSRYGKAHELEIMATVIDGLHPGVRQIVKTIWCDSKATCTYSVEITNYSPPLAYAVGLLLEGLLLANEDGHNGIFVSRFGGGAYEERIDIDPYWPDYE